MNDLKKQICTKLGYDADNIVIDERVNNLQFFHLTNASVLHLSVQITKIGKVKKHSLRK